MLHLARRSRQRVLWSKSNGYLHKQWYFHEGVLLLAASWPNPASVQSLLVEESEVYLERRPSGVPGGGVSPLGQVR